MKLLLEWGNSIALLKCSILTKNKPCFNFNIYNHLNNFLSIKSNFKKFNTNFIKLQINFPYLFIFLNCKKISTV